MARRIIGAQSLVYTAVMWVALLVIAPRAQAIAISSCGGEPFAFESAEVNVVVLPYFQALRHHES